MTTSWLLVTEAESSSAQPEPIVCTGAAHPELEAWFLHGFEAQNEAEKSLLSAERQNLGFDPTSDAHRLNPKREHDPDGKPVKTSTKGVLDRLTQDDPVRRERCWRSVPLKSLRKRGNHSGLTAFIEDIEKKLVPQIAGKLAANP